MAEPIHASAVPDDPPHGASEALLATALRAAEAGYAPDWLIRWGIRQLLRSGLRERKSQEKSAESELIARLRRSPIAVETDRANRQHYALPPALFAQMLGPRLKYSCCHWPEGVQTLAQAEESSLAQVAERAELRDGQEILELGCGWGSLTLWMGQHYPTARITAVSNSAAQREFIEARAAVLGVSNVRVLTEDMNTFNSRRRFDRVVSIEMFEHMRNYELLLARIADWLEPGGRLFVHIFVHGQASYLFESRGPADWMSTYFFSGGIMPSDGLLANFQRDLQLVQQWRLDGRHYERTANAWLRRFDENAAALTPVLAQTYGAGEVTRWRNRWRIFLMACAEMFGFERGERWWVSHYLFAPR